MPEVADDIFHHYRVLRREDGRIWELGRGAMGVTYKAVDENLDAIVALKLINQNAFEDQDIARARFRREAKAAASLRHRNVAGVFHYGEKADQCFYAMEFVEGETIDALVKRAGPRPWTEALAIVRQVARALIAAHARGLVHRDIKPANVMLVDEVDEAGVVKLIDFGLAKSVMEVAGTRVGVAGSGFVGTPLFTSPEQCDEQPADIRSDIYSLGVTLWFLLTGQPPFKGNLARVLAQHMDKPPPFDLLSADIPETVRALLARMLAKDRADRPQDPATLRAALETCLRGTDIGDFQHYRVLRREDGQLWKLGQGAVGTTYKARDINLDILVALKVINDGLLRDENARTRFVREARFAAALRHRNVAGIHYLGRHWDEWFYAMEFVEGETIDALVKRAGPRPWTEALAIVRQVARALIAAHARGLVHRDIKPANVMLVDEVDEAGVVKLIDFGLAKSVAEETANTADDTTIGFVGTPLFASPEQLEGQPPDIRSDIYSLGITLWFLLTGQFPFTGTLAQVVAQHFNAAPPFDKLSADVSEPVRALLARMLAKGREGRPQTPADLRAEIEACLQPTLVADGGANSVGRSLPLSEVLRARGKLAVGEVVRLLYFLAREVEEVCSYEDNVYGVGMTHGYVSRCKIPPGLNLDPTQVSVRFESPSPPNLATRSVNDWPWFMFELSSIQTAAKTAQAPASKHTSGTDDYLGIASVTRQVAALAYTLLGGRSPQPGRYQPLSDLNEAVNTLLWRGLNAGGDDLIPSGFVHELKRIAG